MLILSVLTLFLTAHSADLDPSLTEWRLIKTDYERVMFPLRDYILEVKATLPDNYNTSPEYKVGLQVVKDTTMMAVLHEGGWGPDTKVGRLVWNTIKYDRGFDVSIEECDARYYPYKSFPANGEKEQIWNWNFFDEMVLLTCNDELQYSKLWKQGDVHNIKTGLPEKCRALGQANVDRIIFKHMAGEYIRAKPKNTDSTNPGNLVRETTSAVTTPPTTPPPTDGSSNLPKDFPTCNCWSRECGYCSRLDCTVKHDLVSAETGIQVKSFLNRKDLNSIVLYDEEGEIIGKFRWNLRGMFLDGCVACRTPWRLRRAVRALNPADGPVSWEFSLTDGVVRVKIDGVVLFENRMRGECKGAYSRASRFAFHNLGCENSFTLYPGMEKGAQITPTCNDACPKMF